MAGGAAGESGTWSEEEESESEEEEKEVSDAESLVELDYAAEMRRRAREEAIYQQRKDRHPSPPPDRGAERQSWTSSRADPFDMMPRRYTVGGAAGVEHKLSSVAAVVALGGIAAARSSRRMLRRAVESEAEAGHRERRLRLEALSRDLDAQIATSDSPTNGRVHDPPATTMNGGFAAEAAGSGDAGEGFFHPGMLCRMLEEETRRDEESWKGSDDDKFDQAQSILENMVSRDKNFRTLQRQFLREHCMAFSAGENRLECWPIFRRWEALMEESVHQRLRREIPGFEMEGFLEILVDRGEEVSGDVWELLLSLTDFSSFKQRMLSEQERVRAGLDDSSEEEGLEEWMEEARRITRAAKRRVKRQHDEDVEQQRRDLAVDALAAVAAGAMRADSEGEESPMRIMRGAHRPARRRGSPGAANDLGEECPGPARD